MVKSCAFWRSKKENEAHPDSRRERLHRPSPVQAHPGEHRLGSVRHGHAGRSYRGRAGRSALSLLRRRHHHQPRVDRIPHPQVRHGAAAGGDRHTGDLRQGAAARLRARLRGQPADRARLRAIIANKGGIASGKIYNIGNPRNNISVRELAESMVKLALDYPEYRTPARRVRIIKTTAERYYGRGYQDVQNRVPKIDNTMRELRWRPRVGMKDALRRIYDAYRTDVAEARHLVK